MKFLWLAIFVLSSTPVWSQAIDPTKFDTYEAQKLDKATALCYLGFVPGGGMFYAGKDKMGFLYLIGEGSLAYLAVSDIRRERGLGGWFWGLMVLRIVEISKTFDAVDQYNRQLRVSLNLAAMPDGGKVSASFQF